MSGSSKLAVFDLDGPLLDGRKRHYACYSGILTTNGFKPISIDEYWSFKRSCLKMDKILEMSGASHFYPTFKGAWLEQIENKELLGLDVLQPNVKEFLTELNDIGVVCIIATLRQHAEGVGSQLQRLGIANYFKAVHVSPSPDGAHGKAQGVKFICQRDHLTPKVWIGDTEIDAQAAKLLDIPCALVTTGLRDKNHLISIEGCSVFNALKDIPWSFFE